MMKRRERVRSPEEESFFRSWNSTGTTDVRFASTAGRPDRNGWPPSASREDCSYMRDLVSDDQERIRKINFIKIREKGGEKDLQNASPDMQKGDFMNLF